MDTNKEKKLKSELIKLNKIIEQKNREILSYLLLLKDNGIEFGQSDLLSSSYTQRDRNCTSEPSSCSESTSNLEEKSQQK